MQGRWYRENSLEAREKLMQELTSMMVIGKVWNHLFEEKLRAENKRAQLKEPIHSILTIPKEMDDDNATALVRSEIDKATSKSGMFGKKLLLKFEP